MSTKERMRRKMLGRRRKILTQISSHLPMIFLSCFREKYIFLCILVIVDTLAGRQTFADETAAATPLERVQNLWQASAQYFRISINVSALPTKKLLRDSEVFASIYKIYKIGHLLKRKDCIRHLCVTSLYCE